MAVDLAIDYNTGDLILSPNRDLEIRVGDDVISQRIRVRLRISQGDWLLDPTNGTLGSRMLDVLRLPVDVAMAEVELVIREALAPMTDIRINSVDVKLAELPNAFIVQLVYTAAFDDIDTTESTTLTLNIAA